jgi:hypothetical protein
MLISMQNRARVSGDRKALKLDTALRKIARWRSKDMIERDYFSHTIKGTDHNVFWYMQHEYGYCFKVAGENIGTVTWEGATVEEATNWVFNAFMDSSGHRANIMGKAWDVVAVGAYKGPGDKFMWTVLSPTCGTTAPKPTLPTPSPRQAGQPPGQGNPKPTPAHAHPPRPRRRRRPAPRRLHACGAASPQPTERPRPTAISGPRRVGGAGTGP